MSVSSGAGGKKRPRKPEAESARSTAPKAASERAIVKRPAKKATGEPAVATSAIVPSSDEGSKKPTPATDEKQDLLYVHSKRESSGAYNVIRQRKDRVEFGEMRELRQGKPIIGEVVKLSPRQEHEQLFDVEVLMDGGEQPSRAHGPARVANSKFRDNWDSIFGEAAEPDPGHDDVLN